MAGLGPEVPSSQKVNTLLANRSLGWVGERLVSARSWTSVRDFREWGIEEAYWRNTRASLPAEG